MRPISDRRSHKPKNHGKAWNSIAAGRGGLAASAAELPKALRCDGELIGLSRKMGSCNIRISWQT